MIWHSVNSEDNPEEVKLEELPEDVVQDMLMRKEKGKKMVRARTEVLDAYIEKLTPDQKMKDVLKMPINVTKDFACVKSTFGYHCNMIVDVSDALARHLLEKVSASKKSAKKLKEVIDRDMERDSTYFAFLKSKTLQLKRN